MTGYKRIYLTSGGTGGHLFPALSLAENLKTKGIFDIQLLTDMRGKTYCKNNDIQATALPLKKPDGDFGKVLHILSLAISFLICFMVFVFKRPHIVVGFGGYPSLPAMVAAQLLNIPTVLHEQNALMGKANRFLQNRCKRVAVSFPKTHGARLNVNVTGNPVRKIILDAINKEKTFQPGIHILVLGGSQGAKIFSNIIPDAIALMKKSDQESITITQQCRPEFLDETRERYKNLHCDVTLQPFFHDMGERYNACDMVIARAGASSVAEIANLGIPAIFVPFQASSEGDQRYNAQIFDEHKAGWMILEENLTPENLYDHIETIKNDPILRQTTSQNAKTLGNAKAAENLTKIVLDLLN